MPTRPLNRHSRYVGAMIPAEPVETGSRGVVRVLIVDASGLNRECVVAELARHGLDVSCAADLPSLLSRIDQGAPEVVLLNIGAADSATLLQVSLDIDQHLRVVVFGLSQDRESEIVACAEAGVAGLHLQSESLTQLLALLNNVGQGRALCSPEISAILLRQVYTLAGQPDPEQKSGLLTAREDEILRLIEEGLTNQQIASRLSLTLHTVKNHVHNLLTKLGVASRAEAVAVSRATRYANPDPGRRLG